MRPYSSAERPLEAFVRPIAQPSRRPLKPGSVIGWSQASKMTVSCFDRGTVVWRIILQLEGVRVPTC